MPIKRRPVLKKSAPSRAATPRLLSSDEKRQLILAHAASRRPMDPVQRMSLWAGVIICTLFIIGGWMYTVGAGIKKSLAGPLDLGLGDVQAEIGKINSDGDVTGDLGKAFNDVNAKFKALEDQQKLLDTLAQQLAAPADVTTSTNGIFKPKSVTATTTKNQTTD